MLLTKSSSVVIDTESSTSAKRDTPATTCKGCGERYSNKWFRILIGWERIIASNCSLMAFCDTRNIYVYKSNIIISIKSTNT